MKYELIPISYGLITVWLFGVIKASFLLIQKFAHLKWFVWHNFLALGAAVIWPISILLGAFITDRRERTWIPVYWAKKRAPQIRRLL